LPAPDSLSSTGYGIYHIFEPDEDQEMKVYLYDTDGYQFSVTLDLDDETAWGTAVQNEANYFKYKSTVGTRIEGTGTVY